MSSGLMMAEQQAADPNSGPTGLPLLKKPRMSETDVLAGLLDLPDELKDISSNSFLGAPPTNSIDPQQSMEMGGVGQQLPPTANMSTPPMNPMNSTGTPSPSNIALSSQLNAHMLGNATPPPNAVISTSGDPTPTLPSISASPSHSAVSSSPMLPSATGGGAPYQMHGMYARPHGNMGMHPSGMGGAPPPPMDGRLLSYNHAHTRQYNPNVPMTTRMMGSPYNAPPHMGMHHQPMMAPPQPMNNMGDHGFPPMVHQQHMHPNMYPPGPPRGAMGGPHNMQPGAGMGGPGHMEPPSQQQSQSHLSSGIPAPASSASNDPEKRKLIQQQLVLLLHAHRCQQREREQQAHGAYRPCALPHCRTMKNVLNHMTECQAGRDCNFPHCASSRQIIYHWKSCNQQECPVCLPLKTTRGLSSTDIPANPGNFPGGGGAGGGTNPAYQSSVGLPVAPGPTGVGGGMLPNQPSLRERMTGNFPSPNTAASQQPQQNQGITRPPVHVPPNHVRNWHADVNSDLRNHLIRKLVEAIYPASDQQAVQQDSRVASLFQYAVRVEKAMFESANSREDYYQKLAEKIYRVRKELDEKRRQKRGAPIVNGSIEDGAHSISVASHMTSQSSGSGSQMSLGSPDLSSNQSLTLPPTPLSDTSELKKSDVLMDLISTTRSLPGGGGLPMPFTPTSKTALLEIKEELFQPSILSLDDHSSLPPILSPKKEQQESIPMDIKPDTSLSQQDILGGVGGGASSSIPNSVVARTPQTPSQDLSSIPSNRPTRRESVTDSSYLPQATPTYNSPLPTPLTATEEKTTSSSSRAVKIKPDPTLIKIFQPDELEVALTPVFNAVWTQDPEALPFHKPVDPEALGIPDYFDIIKNPIDLSKIGKKLRQGEYSNPWEFCNDMQLMFDNAWTYNKKTSRVYKFCSKLSEVFYENIDQVMVSLGYCCGQKHVFHPQVLYCYGKLCPIPRDSPYYGYQNKYVYCTKCFTEIPGDNISVCHDGTTTTSLSKGAFKEMKNDSVGVEPMVECIHCKRIFHKICVLYHDAIWPEGYQCPSCLRKLQTTRKENRFVARRLPSTKLGNFLEERVNTFLRQAGVEGADVTIRVVSSSNKFLDTRLGMVDRFSFFPNQFPYRTKALFVFEEIDGAEVCFFGMHVQEYGSDCPTPNTRRVYISYLDSVHFFRPKEYRTLVYHEILIGYLDFCKQNGYQTAHIWACPPGEGDDYIFHCHPIEQKIPKPKRLVEWYRNMLERGKEQQVLFDFQDIFQYCTEAEITTVTDIPYFEGDFWPNVIEETIKELDQEEEERKASEALSVDLQRPGSKKAGKRGTSKKGSKKAASRTKIGKKSNPLVSGDDLTQKIYQTMDKHKEVFFVVFLQPPNQLSSPLPATTDPDSLVTCELMDGRDAFLNLAREKHWEFSSLRRAKFSTMSMLYELHNQGDRFIYSCNNCHSDVEFRWHCKECEDYDLCATCYQKIGHEHPMEKLGFNMGDEDPKSTSVTTLSRTQVLKRRNEFLIHACQCRDHSCSKPLCIKMKQLLRHARDCKMRASGKCTACNFFIKMCAMHAQECRETKCPVPLCANLKQKMRERRLREQARSFQLADRRIKAMNRSNASPTAANEEPTSSGAGPSGNNSNKPQPSPATPQMVSSVHTPGKAAAAASPNPRTPGGGGQLPIPASPAAPLTNPGTPFIPPGAPHTPPVMKPPETAVATAAPNVVVQPPPTNQQQAIENNIQRLVQALCSTPQDNLKAKEYLRNHTELVPKVIQGLHMQGRDQEVAYLKQEFMTAAAMSGRFQPQGYQGRGTMMNPSRPMMHPQNHFHQPYQNAVMHHTAPVRYGGGAHMTQPHPQHPHLQHMLQTRPQTQYGPMGGFNMGMGTPPGVHAAPPQYMKQQQRMYGNPSMMMQSIPPQSINPAMRPMPGAMSGGGPPMVNQMPQRLSMHQYRPPPPMDPTGMGMGDGAMLQHQYNHPYHSNTNSNNSNNSSSTSSSSSTNLSLTQHYRTL